MEKGRRHQHRLEQWVGGYLSATSLAVYIMILKLFWMSGVVESLFSKNQMFFLLLMKLLYDTMFFESSMIRTMYNSSCWKRNEDGNKR